MVCCCHLVGGEPGGWPPLVTLPPQGCQAWSECTGVCDVSTCRHATRATLDTVVLLRQAGCRPEEGAGA